MKTIAYFYSFMYQFSIRKDAVDEAEDKATFFLMYVLLGYLALFVSLVSLVLDIHFEQCHESSFEQKMRGYAVGIPIVIVVYWLIKKKGQRLLKYYENANLVNFSDGIRITLLTITPYILFIMTVIYTQGR